MSFITPQVAKALARRVEQTHHPVSERLFAGSHYLDSFTYIVSEFTFQIRNYTITLIKSDDINLVMFETPKYAIIIDDTSLILENYFGKGETIQIFISTRLLGSLIMRYKIEHNGYDIDVHNRNSMYDYKYWYDLYVCTESDDVLQRDVIDYLTAEFGTDQTIFTNECGFGTGIDQPTIEHRHHLGIREDDVNFYPIMTFFHRIYRQIFKDQFYNSGLIEIEQNELFPMLNKWNQTYEKNITNAVKFFKDKSSDDIFYMTDQSRDDNT